MTPLRKSVVTPASSTWRAYAVLRVAIAMVGVLAGLSLALAQLRCRPDPDPVPALVHGVNCFLERSR